MVTVVVDKSGPFGVTVSVEGEFVVPDVDPESVKEVAPPGEDCEMMAAKREIGSMDYGKKCSMYTPLK
jgi:hypothetical protein